MTATALGLAWALLVGLVAARHRPLQTRRVRALLHDGAPRHRLEEHKRLDIPVPPPKTLVAIFGGIAVSALVFPPLAVGVLAIATLRPLLAKRQRTQRHTNTVERDVADLVTLLGLAVNAGHNLSGALRVASARGNGPVATAVRTQMALVERGVRLADALEALPDSVGEPVRPFVAALVSCDRYGASVTRTLDRLALDVRTASRQRAEAAARRLPIRLIFPLVTCILPAFGLLTVAPLIAGSLRELRL